MNIAILLAGGVGKRLGAGKPKQFVELLGRPMILYALEIYEQSPSIDAIEVVCVPEYIDYVWQLAREYNITKLKWVCEGGASCQESTRNGTVSYTHLDVYKRQAYAAKKWAFVSDYARLSVLVEYGGIYMDTCLLYTSRCV